MTAPAPPATRASWWHRTREARAGYLFVLPMLLLFIVFRFAPTVESAFFSFTEFYPGGVPTLVGLDNYTRLLEDPTFWDSLQVTVVFALILVPLTVGMALGTALGLHHVIFWRGFFRGVYFLPYVTSLILAAVIWEWAYDEEDGLINGLLSRFGVEPLSFLGDSVLVLPAVALMVAWKNFGYSMLILLAGLQAVPPSYVEAARVDGASGMQIFRLIVLPLLRPVLFFVIVINTVIAFQIFEPMYVMTGGGPVHASYTLVYLLYDSGFKYLDFGYASTVGMVLFLIVVTISLAQRYALDREKE
ncbi:MAG: carbohydrate ABC transporter permease [Micromonosporaceae bacterium]